MARREFRSREHGGRGALSALVTVGGVLMASGGTLLLLELLHVALNEPPAIFEKPNFLRTS